MTRNPFPIRLKDAYFVTPNVRHLIFEKADGSVFPFVPGQFVTLHFPEEKGIPAFHRSYSLANLALDPTQNTDIEFAISRVPSGRATEILFGLEPGSDQEMLTATGPFGRLILPEKWDPTHRRLILIATGTGVTPYRSMLGQIQALLQSQQLERVVLMLGIREKAELLYGEDFLDFELKNPLFYFMPCYSRETQESLSGQEKRGYVQSYLQDLKPNPEFDLIYLCGNPNMVDETYQRLSELGFNARQIRREKYISSK